MIDIVAKIPTPDPLAVAAIWFQILLTLTYFLHLISTGITFGTAAQAVVAHRKATSNPKWRLVANTHARILPFAIAFTINSGVAPLLFLQTLYGNFFYTSAITIAIPLLSLLVFLLLSYYLAYRVILKKESSAKWRSAMSVMVTLFFSAVAFILVNANTLMLTPQRWKIYFSSMAGWNLNLGETTLVPRYTFYLFIFLAIGGAFSAIFFRWRGEEKNVLGFHFGASLAGYFSFVAAPAFTLFLLMLPETIRNSIFTANRWWGTAVILFIILLILSGWYFLRRRIIPAALMLSIALILFVLIRNHIRQLYLQPFKTHFSEAAAETEIGVLALFFLMFLIGIALLMWLLVKVKREYKSCANQRINS